jgi:hypothetical protein
VSVTEYERHLLFNWFEEHMGPERAETMMKLVPPVGWGDVATHEQIQQLETATGEKFQRLRHELAELEVRLDAKLEAKLEAKLGGLQRTFATWLFTSQAAVIGAVALLLAID